MTGRKPEPTRLKVLKGNPRGKPLNKHEPQAQVILPKCPRELKGKARAEWNKVVPILHSTRILTELDLSLLKAYCQAWRLLQDAQEHLALDVKQNGDFTITSAGGQVYQNPHVGLVQRQFQIVRSLQSELGMTPSARSKISVAPQGKEGGFDF
ncbi:MAG: phage terminase small subunit P27 family [Planctomycetota bacterium]